MHIVRSKSNFNNLCHIKNQKIKQTLNYRIKEIINGKAIEM